MLGAAAIVTERSFPQSKRQASENQPGERNRELTVSSTQLTAHASNRVKAHAYYSSLCPRNQQCLLEVCTTIAAACSHLLNFAGAIGELPHVASPSLSSHL